MHQYTYTATAAALVGHSYEKQDHLFIINTTLV